MMRSEELSAVEAKEVPGPKPRYAWGNLLEYSRDPLGFLTRCCDRYGDIVRVHFPGPPVFIINDPGLIENVLVKDSRNFIKEREVRKDLSLLGEGLLTSEGALWRRQRKLSQPAFHHERVQTYGKVMVDYAQRMLSTSWRDGEVRDVHQDMAGLALQIAAKTLVGADIISEAADAGRALKVVMERASDQGSSLFVRMIPEGVPTPGNLRFRWARRRLDSFILEIIEERRASGRDTGDLLSMLLNARDEEGNGMAENQLRDEVMTMFLAGQETTAVTLSWTWYLLSKHTEIEDKLLAEFSEVLDGRAPTVADLPQLSYAEKVVKEAMRLYPPAWAVGREAVKECKIGGYRIPEGSQLFMCQWVVHRDPRFFPDPELFDPERWSDGLERRLPRFAYFPFGGGPRQCIGQSFATMETLLILATITPQFRVRPVGRGPILPQPSVTLRPRGGVRAMLHRRG
ncbi:MAG TPA: cytochrome P450 [Terrimicrobiaceae bacterium]